jgi:hypothetical protein
VLRSIKKIECEAAMPHIETLDYVWCALATLFALPGVVFIAYTTMPRMKMLCALGALIGGVLGFFLTFFVWFRVLDGIHLDGSVLFVTDLFFSSVTGLVGALIVSFIFGANTQRPRSTQVEY